MKARLLPGVLVLLTCFATPCLLAQTNTEINAGLQFNFSNPGARSLALGGAFMGLADDATAAYTNPAGLVNLSRPEISLEGRYFEYKNEFLDKGHANGTATGNGLDNIDGPVYKEDKDHVTNLNFASFVYPGSGWAIAGYRQELANFEAHSETQGAFFTNPDGSTSRFFPVQASVRLKIVNYGISGAVRLAEGLSLGVGGFWSKYTQTTDLTRYNLGDINNDLPCFVTNTACSVADNERVDGDDSTFSFNAGLLWKISRAFSIGAVYRKGPQFDFTTTATDSTGAQVVNQKGHFRVPDIYGAGLAARPTDYLTITFDYDRVKYSQFAPDHFVDIFGDAQGNPEPQNYKIDDGNEYRAGVQWAIPMGQNVLALRVGWWSDPDHKVRYTGAQIDEQILFQSGKTENHYCGGVGFSAGQHFQFDLGIDSSSLVTTGAASAVFRF